MLVFLIYWKKEIVNMTSQFQNHFWNNDGGWCSKTKYIIKDQKKKSYEFWIHHVLVGNSHYEELNARTAVRQNILSWNLK